MTPPSSRPSRPSRPSGPPGPPPDAPKLVGLLAEDGRLRVFAAVVLGAGTLDEVAAASGLSARDASSALERLAGGGLVVADPGTGRLQPSTAALKDAARRAAPPPQDPQALHPWASREDAAVLAAFVEGDRLRSIPAQHGKRRVVLDWLARRFEPGKVYPERDVNFLLGLAHADTAALRRYLVDGEFLERRDGFYWRAGGTFDIDDGTGEPEPGDSVSRPED